MTATPTILRIWWRRKAWPMMVIRTHSMPSRTKGSVTVTDMMYLHGEGEGW